MNIKPDHTERCHICGRPADGNLMVRTDGGSHAIHPDDPRTDDSGWFSVGPECAKKIGLDYVRKVEA